MRKANDETLQLPFKTAAYKEQKISDYMGNPLIEALPPIFECEDEVIEAFYSIPPISEQEKKLTPKLKSHILWRIKNFLQPLPVHIRLETIISTLIRNSYKARNPLHPPYKQKIQVLNQMRGASKCTIADIENAFTCFSSTAECAIISGVSGTGKTTAVNRTLSLYPQVIRHEAYQGKPFTRTQIVWLKVDCPFDGNFATLCRSIFKEIDRLTGERWLEKYGYLTRSTSTMVMHLTTLLTNYNVGALAIDEIQHLSRLKDDAIDMLDFFVTLTNMFSVPIIFIGTSKAKSMFQTNFRLARRVQSGGYVEMGPLKKDSDEWNLFLESLWDFNVLDQKTMLDEKLRDTFHNECQGIIAIAVMLFMCAQGRALLSQEPALTTKIIKETADNDLRLIRPMITALQSGDPIKIAEFDDICMNEEEIWKNIQHDIEMEKRVNDAIVSKKMAIKEKRQNSHDSLYFNICSSNLFPQLDQDEIRNILDTVIGSCSANIEENELKELVMARILSAAQKKKKPVGVAPLNKNNLLIIYEEAIKRKTHPYELFKKAELIKNPFEEFMKAV